jgi:hypothetical protein
MKQQQGKRGATVSAPTRQVSAAGNFIFIREKIPKSMDLIGFHF